jgi:alpha,alpha-trehalase
MAIFATRSDQQHTDDEIVPRCPLALRTCERSMSAFSSHQIIRRLLPLLEQAGWRLITLIVVLCCAIHAQSAKAQIATCASELPPSEQLDELFRNVQLKGVFPDSKTFADLHFDESPNSILADYGARKVETGFDLGAFVYRHFSLPA